MIPAEFPESNGKFRPPKGLDESQCMTISAFVGQVVGGSVDGCQVVVTAWRPTEQELADIIAGKPIFFSSIGGLPPHFLTTDFHQATHPS